MNDRYEHARCFPEHEDDVCYEPEPTAAQMERLRCRDLQNCYRNVMLSLAQHPHTAHDLAQSTLHSERTLAFALGSLESLGLIRRDGRRYRPTWDYNAAEGMYVAKWGAA